jgi:hypothetical protein
MTPGGHLEHPHEHHKGSDDTCLSCLFIVSYYNVQDGICCVRMWTVVYGIRETKRDCARASRGYPAVPCRHWCQIDNDIQG